MSKEGGGEGGGHRVFVSVYSGSLADFRHLYRLAEAPRSTHGRWTDGGQ